MSNFKIYGIEISTSDPYKEGQPLSGVEADTLNSHRAELISHRVRSFIKAELGVEAPAQHEFTADQIKQINDKAKELDKNFDFATAGGGGGRTLDPVEKEAREIARAAVDTKLAQAGKSKAKRGEQPGEGEIGHDHYNMLVSEVSAKPDVRKRAKANVEAAQAAGASINIG